MKGIYLDYAATTPVAPEVQDALAEAFAHDFGNPSSTYRIGKAVKSKIEAAREHIARTLNAKPQDITFTSSGTEANDTAILTTVKRLNSKGKHIITSVAEHSSVHKTMEKLAAEGYDVTRLSYDETGHISLEELKAAIRPDTILISLMHGNNEVGSLQPIKEIGQICAEKDIFFHTDTVQTYMKIPIDVEAMHIDAMALSAHKIFGPKGIGFLYYRNSKENFTSFLPGGGQENGRRASTESWPLIAGLEEAVSLKEDHLSEEESENIALREYFLKQAEERGLHLEINGPQQPELANILSVYWPGHPNDQVLIQMDLHDIYLSAGSACNAGSIKPSRVLVAMYGEDSPRLKESLRISFGPQTKKEELDHLLAVMVDLQEKLQTKES